MSKDVPKPIYTVVRLHIGDSENIIDVRICHSFSTMSAAADYIKASEKLRDLVGHTWFEYRMDRHQLTETDNA
jgi:hypothetical protein